MRPIVIGGCYRSGTSLVRRLLNAHSRIYCGPEIKFFQDFFNDYRIDDPTGHVRFLSSARSVVSNDDLFELFGAAFISLHERAAARAGKSRWADKAPENMIYLNEWSRLLGDDWVLVHIVRHPLDTIASLRQLDWNESIPGDLQGQVEMYDRYTRSGLRFGTAQPHRYRRIVYEDLVDRPAHVVSGLMTWLDESYEPDQLRFNEFPHQLGIEDPKVVATTTIHNKSVGRWASVLSADDVQYIVGHVGPLWRELDPEQRHPESGRINTAQTDR